MFEIGLYSEQNKRYDYLKACIYMLQQLNKFMLKKKSINQIGCYLASCRPKQLLI